MTSEEVRRKVRENRVRRIAARRGLRVVKSRRLDPNALSYGRFMILDVTQSLAGAVVGGVGPTGEPSWTLEQVEEWLESGFDQEDDQEKELATASA